MYDIPERPRKRAKAKPHPDTLPLAPGVARPPPLPPPPVDDPVALGPPPPDPLPQPPVADEEEQGVKANWNQTIYAKTQSI